MLNHDVLIMNGYGKHKAGHKQYADCMYQKPFWVNQQGDFVSNSDPTRYKKAFYLNIYHYPAWPEHNLAESWSSDMRCYSKTHSWDIELMHEKNHALGEIEEFYKAQYKANDCIPDLHNND